MNGVEGPMMTGHFLSEYRQDVFTAEPTCIIGLPRLYDETPWMPHVIDLSDTLSTVIRTETMANFEKKAVKFLKIRNAIINMSGGQR